MMKLHRNIVIGMAILAGATLGFGLKTVLADGIPKENPFYYSGFLQESGVPVEGERAITVNLWPDETSTGSPICQTVVSNAPVKAGRFRIALVDACRAALRQNSNAYVEVVAGAISLGRAKIGAVPYALEAERASDLASPQRDRLVPTGSVFAFAGTTPPQGWLLCNGAAVSRTEYATLFNAIGVTYGKGDGATTFNLPDLRGRFAVGAGDGAGLSGHALAQKAGSETVQLTEAQLPAHTHAVSDPGHTHPPAGATFVGGGWNQGNAKIPETGSSYGFTSSTGASGTGISIGATGGGAAIPIMPPMLALNYMIKS